MEAQYPQPDLYMDGQVVEVTPEQAVQPQETSRWQRMREAAGNTALAAFVALEVNPITNEGLRIGAFAAAQGSFDNPYVSAATFAGATFAIEESGALATARLLDTPTAGKAVSKLNAVLDKVGLARVLHTNVATEAGIAAVAGAPAAMVVKHRQNPERTEKENRRYGTIASLGITAMSGAQGYMVAEGLSNPSPLTVGAATAAVGATIGIGRWLKTRKSGASEETK